MIKTKTNKKSNYYWFEIRVKKTKMVNNADFVIVYVESCKMTKKAMLKTQSWIEK